MGTMFNQVFEFALVKTPTSVFIFVMSLYRRLKASGKRNEETRAFTILYENRWEPVLKAVFAVVIVVWVVWKFFWLILFTSIIGGSLWLCLRKEEREEMKKDEQQTTFFQIVREEENMLPRLKPAEVMQREMQQQIRNNEMMHAGLFAELTNVFTKAVGNGAGELSINATKMETLHPDGAQATQTSLVVGVVIDSKLKGR